MFLRCSRIWVCRCSPEPQRATMCVYLLTAKQDLERRTPWWGHRWGGHWKSLHGIVYILTRHILGNATVTQSVNPHHAALTISKCEHCFLLYDSPGLHWLDSSDLSGTPVDCTIQCSEHTDNSTTWVSIVVVVWSKLRFSSTCRVSLGLKTLFLMGKTQAEWRSGTVL